MKIPAENLTLLEGAERTYLSAAAAVSDTTLTVRRGTGFGTAKIMLIGNFGEESTELEQTHASTASTATTITMKASTSLSHAHEIDSPVTLLDFDQIEFSRATTLTGAKTVLATTDIDVDSETTIYDDTTNTTGFAFIRFKNSITALFSDYSAGVSYSGYEFNSVRKIKEKALRLNNLKYGQTDDEAIDEDALIDAINDCQEEVYTLYPRSSCFEESEDETTVASTSDYDVPTGWEHQELILRYDGGEPFRYVSYHEYLRIKSANVGNGTPTLYTIYDNKIKLWPTPGAEKTLEKSYFKRPAVLTSETGTVVVPAIIASFYVAARIAEIRLDDKRSKTYNAKFEDKVEKFAAQDDSAFKEDGGVVETTDSFELYGEDNYIL